MMTDDYTPTTCAWCDNIAVGWAQIEAGYGDWHPSCGEHGARPFHVNPEWLTAHDAEKDAVIAAQAAAIDAAKTINDEPAQTAEDARQKSDRLNLLLTSVPSVSLDAVKAEAWDEGFKSGTDYAGESEHGSPRDAKRYTVNPYRSGGQS
jgi:hypothetical protein